MTLYEFSLSLGLISTGVVLITSIVYLTARMAKTELKVDTMWAFQLQRGFGEALDKGLLIKNSPTKVTDKAKQMYAPLKQELIDFYNKYPQLNDLALAINIQKTFGKQLVQKICIPYKVNDAACLVIAVAVAKSTDSVELDDYDLLQRIQML